MGTLHNFWYAAAWRIAEQERHSKLIMRGRIPGNAGRATILRRGGQIAEVTRSAPTANLSEELKRNEKISELS